MCFAQRLKALAEERRRFGYRRLHVLLRREGHAVNRKRVQRIYREEKLTVRRRGGRKRAIGTRAPLDVPRQSNERWSLDFVSDQMTDGRRFRILAVVDDRSALRQVKACPESQVQTIVSEIARIDLSRPSVVAWSRHRRQDDEEHRRDRHDR